MSATMRLFTTPEYTLHIPGIDLTPYEVYVTFRQNDKIVTLETSDVTVAYDDGDDETQISVVLSQDQTAEFEMRRSIYVQVNWLNGDMRYATDVAEIPPKLNLLEEIL